MNYKLSLSPLFVLEIIASILFIVFFGFGNFLFFILLSMIFGVILLGIFENMLEFQMGGLKDMLTQFSFVIAGFLLIFPGIITSVFGIFVFFFGIALKLMTKSKYQYTKQEYQNSNEEIIDVEIIEDRK
ncbi:integral memnbrane protein [Campylobacter jejuni]|nr:integral memnbrane protein [Campylobacter jejuni]